MARFILMVVLAVVVTLAYSDEIDIWKVNKQTKEVIELKNACYECMRVADGRKNNSYIGDCVGVDVFQPCGLWRVNFNFWFDSGLPTVPSNETFAYLYKEFPRCAENLECSLTMIERYINRLKRDCDGNGVINCDDHFLLLKHGYSKCKNKHHRQDVQDIFNECKLNHGLM